MNDRVGHTVKRALCALICAALCASGFGILADHGFADAATQSYEDKIAALQAEQDRLRAELDNVRGEALQSIENKANYDALAATTQTKIWLSQTMITQLDNQIAMTEGDIEDTEEKLAETMDRYLDSVRQSYEDGGATYLELILGSEGIADFLARLDRINAILEYDNNLMAKYEDDTAALEQKKKELEAAKKTENEVIESLEADKSSYDALSAQTQSYIDSLSDDEQALAAKYAEIEAEEAALNAQLESFIQQQQAQNQVAFQPSDGFIRPIPAGVGGISCTFGAADPAGNGHRGTDIWCSVGTPIMAPAAGTVIFAGWHWSYGNYVIIDHGGGVSTLYAHCSALLTTTGAFVNQGDVVALVGMTGFVTGPHVHIEYRINGQITNPQYYMPL